MKSKLYSVIEPFKPRAFKGTDKESTTPSILYEETGIRLPDYYLDLLTDFNGAIFFEEGVIFEPAEATPMDDKNGLLAIDLLFGLSGSYGIVAKYKQYGERLPDKLVPIGDAPGGDLICFSPSSNNVIFWMHEAGPSEKTTYTVAKDIKTFLGNLQIEIVDKEEAQKVKPISSTFRFK